VTLNPISRSPRELQILHFIFHDLDFDLQVAKGTAEPANTLLERGSIGPNPAFMPALCAGRLSAGPLPRLVIPGYSDVPTRRPRLVFPPRACASEAKTERPPAVTAAGPAGTTAVQPPAAAAVQPPAVTAAGPAGMTAVQPPALTVVQPPAVTAAVPPAVTDVQSPAVSHVQSPAVTDVEPLAVTDVQPPAATVAGPAGERVEASAGSAPADLMGQEPGGATGPVMGTEELSGTSALLRQASAEVYAGRVGGAVGFRQGPKL
jgi:hypothetical protein